MGKKALIIVVVVLLAASFFVFNPTGEATGNNIAGCQLIKNTYNETVPYTDQEPYEAVEYVDSEIMAKYKVISWSQPVLSGNGIYKARVILKNTDNQKAPYNVTYRFQTDACEIPLTQTQYIKSGKIKEFVFEIGSEKNLSGSYSINPATIKEPKTVVKYRNVTKYRQEEKTEAIKRCS